MRREHTLLTRLNDRRRAPSRVEPRTAAENVEELMESVRQNLARLLNSRHGMSECAPDYGLPAISDLTTGHVDYVQTVERAIQTAIDLYEPRLRRVKVTRSVDDEQGRRLIFRVEGTLVGRTGQQRVWYETSIRGSGEFDVSG